MTQLIRCDEFHHIGDILQRANINLENFLKVYDDGVRLEDELVQRINLFIDLFEEGNEDAVSIDVLVLLRKLLIKLDFKEDEEIPGLSMMNKEIEIYWSNRSYMINENGIWAIIESEWKCFGENEIDNFVDVVSRGEI